MLAAPQSASYEMPRSSDFTLLETGAVRGEPARWELTFGMSTLTEQMNGKRCQDVFSGIRKIKIYKIWEKVMQERISRHGQRG